MSTNANANWPSWCATTAWSWPDANGSAGVEAVERVKALGGEMLQAIGQVQAAEPRLLAIVSAVGAPYDGRSVLVDGRWQGLAEALASVDSWYPPRVPGFTPFADEQVNTLRTATGDWVRARSADQTELHPEQPPKVERPHE